MIYFNNYYHALDYGIAVTGYGGLLSQICIIRIQLVRNIVQPRHFPEWRNMLYHCVEHASPTSKDIDK